MRSPYRLLAYFCIGLSALVSSSVQAQINPDQTLGLETSVITPGVDIRGGQATLIEGGAIRDFNLFHSFSDFNVGESDRVYFASPSGIDSIFSRVTGSNPSDIFGTLGVAGPASLYFLNPNGIVWGADATLDVAGSLSLTTGEAIAFDSDLFSATVPSQSQLLAVRADAAFFNYLTDNSGDITLRGDLNLEGDIAIAGNNITMTGAIEPGESISLFASDSVQFQGVTGQARTGAFSGIDRGGRGIGRNIVIEAAHLEVLDGAEISTATAGMGNAGSIFLNIDESVRLAGQHPDSGRPSRVTSGVELGGEGQGGNLVINANSLEAVDGAQLRSVVAGNGNAGDVILNISGIARFSAGKTPETELSGIIADVTGEGQGGNITVNAGRLEVLSGAQFSTDLLNNGNAGSVTVAVQETAQFVGNRESTTRTGGVFSRVGEQGEGQGGNIVITAQNIDVLTGAKLSSELSGAGNAGNILLIIGETARFSGSNMAEVSGAFSQVNASGEGQSGNIRIVATGLAVLDGAKLAASTAGRGNAGNLVLEISEGAQFAGRSVIDGAAGGVFSTVRPTGEGQAGSITISAANVDLFDGAQINATVQGLGNAGTIVMTVAETARFEGSAIATPENSGVFSRVDEKGEGQSGTISLSAGNLRVRDGAQLSTSMAGRGNAGNIVIAVRDLAQFEGRGNNTRLRNSQPASGAFSRVTSTGEGQGGNIEITAGDLVLTGGAMISTELANSGNAGDISIESRDSVRLSGSGSGAFSRAQGTAAGGSGDVRLLANDLFIDDGAQIAASNEGQGNAGSLSLKVSVRLFANDGSIATNSSIGAGGQIWIGGGVVALSGDSDIQTFVNNGGNRGGNIAIASNAIVLLEDSDLFAFSPDGQGGEIDLSQTVLFSQNPQPVSDRLSRADLLALEGNEQVDINATGGTQSGQVSINTATFVENDLAELTDSTVNTDTLLANSCIARRVEENGSLSVSGRDRLPQATNAVAINQYSVGAVQPIPTESNIEPNFIQEPRAIYQLADGRRVLSRSCDIRRH